MADVEGALIRPVPEDLAAIFTGGPPAWTRLEPQSVSGDPTPGVEARVHDPLWFLARQWQLGEFRGEDTGSPVSVTVTWTATPIDGWHPVDGTVEAFGPGDLLEPLVESEPVAVPGLRFRFEAGSQFLQMFADAGLALALDAVLAAARLLTTPDVAVDGVAPFDPTADPADHEGPLLVASFQAHLPDGERVAVALRGWRAGGPLPAWIPEAGGEVAGVWLAWYEGSASPDCWDPHRLEHRFGVVTGPFDLTADAFGGGRVDWYHFTARPTSAVSSQPLVQRIGPIPATPLRFPGMPADRYWEFEDGAINLGALTAGPFDLARLAFAEYALVYGQDWLVVPIDIPVGEVVVIDELTYRDTFGDDIPVARADEPGRFRLFDIDRLPGLFVPPATPGVLEGDAVEEVLFLRDEIANLVWAVEQTVEGPSGRPRLRIDELSAPTAPDTEVDPDAELSYLIETEVPRPWIPFVPVATSSGAVELHKASLHNGPAGDPRGRLLAPPTMTIEQVAIAREGVVVRRVPMLARRPDGRYARWTTRRASVAGGETSRRIEFDVTPSNHA